MPNRVINELRATQRHAIDFEVTINGDKLTGEPFCDAGHLRDVSDEGLCLITDQAEHYREAQTLKLEIKLPGTDKLEALMLCEATVAWFRTIEDSDNSSVLIGVSLNGPMSFAHRKRDTGASEFVVDER